MATLSASTVTAALAGTTVARKSPVTSSPALGLPQFGAKGGRVRCSTEKAAAGQAKGVAGASLLAAASVVSVSSPVLALVDERMSTEGTGLSLGLSNNLLGWILLGVFGLIWSLFFVYTSTLEEDEESGLSL